MGYEIRTGPWGGGNQFLSAFRGYFEGKGAKIVFKLEDDIDVIVIINPRKESGTFTLRDVLRYKRSNPETKVITRLNDTDKSGKGYKADKLRLESCKISDAAVFISSWLRDYYTDKGFNPDMLNRVIHNGPDKNIFNPNGYNPWDGKSPLKVVTHHWSDNYMKGADIYHYFDELLEDPWMRKRFEFTYVGRLCRMPVKTEFKNTTHIQPLSGQELAQELKKHHIYLTASRWEGCGMHQLEGACCGLPVLFIDEGGGMVETCQGYGIQFSKTTFVISLFKILEKYGELQPKMRLFPLTASKMNMEYEKLILHLLHGKE